MGTATLSSSPVLVYNRYGFAIHDDPFIVYALRRNEAPTYWNPDRVFRVVRPKDGTKAPGSEKASIVGQSACLGTAR